MFGFKWIGLLILSSGSLISGDNSGGQTEGNGMKKTDDCLKNLKQYPDELGKYQALRDLQNTDQDLFYSCLIRNVDEVLPIVYTPGVAEVCLNYAKITGDRGITLKITEEGKLEEELRKWQKDHPEVKEVKAIVVTDGGRILGLGDLGANGMGIPVGKMAIYSALGGVHPLNCLPVTLDVGTNNKLRGDETKYVGLNLERVKGDRYYNFVDEFMKAATKVFGRRTLIQFEDFSNENAFKFLNQYKDKYTVFNDDIQGTAAAALAGILAADRASGQKLQDSVVLFAGAGEAGIGIANILVEYMVSLGVGLDERKARKKIYMKKSDKLIMEGDEFAANDERGNYRQSLPENVPADANIVNLLEIIKWLKPNILIGVSSQKNLFDEAVLKEMAKHNDAPVIFALSNPSEKSECTAKDAYTHTQGKALFASGSPFLPVLVNGKLRHPSQCNNAYIFPGVALAITATQMTTVPNEIFLIAAKTLANECLQDKDLHQDSLFPKLDQLRDCSVVIATKIAEYAFKKGKTAVAAQKDVKQFILDHQYSPKGLKVATCQDGDLSRPCEVAYCLVRSSQIVRTGTYKPKCTNGGNKQIVPESRPAETDNVAKSRTAKAIYSAGAKNFGVSIRILKRILQQQSEAMTNHLTKALFDECDRGVDAREYSLDKYIYLRRMQGRRPETFYKCLSKHVEKILPIIYTPVVVKACKNFKRVVDYSQEVEIGLTLNIKEHKDTIEDILNEWKKYQEEVRIVMVTDGESILTLGDMGANGMVVPVGKLALYSALGGIEPRFSLPVTLDVGTNNEHFLETGSKVDRYVGQQLKRVTGEEYDTFIDKFIQAVRTVFGPTTLIQFEDFAFHNAYRLLEKYQEDYPVLNDDIQGIATIALAGILSVTNIKGTSINDDLKILLVGTGKAALGISTLLLEAMGGKLEDNRKKIYMKGKKGLLTSKFCQLGNGDPRKHFCHEVEGERDTTTLEGIVSWLEPNILIGVSGAKGIFTKEVLQNMFKANEKKIDKCLIMALSVPYSRSECTAQEAQIHAQGCFFVSGSPFSTGYADEVSLKKEESTNAWFRNSRTFQPQAYNDNIFPGVALGIVLAKMKKVPNNVFLMAAQTMAAECIKKSDLEKGYLSPHLKDLKECSAIVAAAIVKYAFDEDLLGINKIPSEWKKGLPNNYKEFVRKKQFNIDSGGPSFLKTQLQRIVKDKCVKDVDAIPQMLDKFIYLRKLQTKEEAEFYKCVIRNVDKMLPIIYTPGVGKACKNYKRVASEGGEVGLTLNIEDHKNNIEKTLWDWKNKQKEVKAIVVTDGERILGLGDLGANGMGIPVGKLALYTALGGIDPSVCLPVTLDVGTNTKALLEEKKDKYVGIQKGRPEEKAYWDFMEEFMQAVVKVYGRTTLIQFEDFANAKAYPLLKKYQESYTVFNDDIQGTAAVAVAGILAAARFRGTKIDDAKVLFAGAGSAALGIANLIVEAMEKGTPEENRKKIYMKDRFFLLTSEKCGDPEFDVANPIRNFCHEVRKGRNTEDLAEMILWMEPNVLIGVSGAHGIFTKEVLQNMAKVNENKGAPIIMPLSNPTSKSECTAEEAHTYAPGCLFASGSPFAPVYVDEQTLASLGSENNPEKPKGKLLKPMQCNNDNIFPGVALGIILAEMEKVPNHVFLIAAKTLAEKCIEEEDFKDGSLYPQPKDLRRCSVKVAAAVVHYAFNNGLSLLKPKPTGWESWTFQLYEDFVRERQYNAK